MATSQGIYRRVWLSYSTILAKVPRRKYRRMNKPLLYPKRKTSGCEEGGLLVRKLMQSGMQWRGS